jgi:hypothetical protein
MEKDCFGGSITARPTTTTTTNCLYVSDCSQQQLGKRLKVNNTRTEYSPNISSDIVPLASTTTN